MPNFRLATRGEPINHQPIPTPPPPGKIGPVPEQAQPAGPDVPLLDDSCVRDAVRYIEKNPLILYGTLVLLGSWLVIRFR